ncbi:MAG: hypothetical protein QNJ64_15030 [Crocosphaera sp.]|nr:hypothetical protein [Crocosphaera sp.]
MKEQTNYKNNIIDNSNQANFENIEPDYDPFLIQEDEEVFTILFVSTDNSSKLDQVLGMIAYARYSRQKHQFVSRYKRGNGKYPSKAEIKAIITSFKDENSDALSSLKQS